MSNSFDPRDKELMDKIVTELEDVLNKKQPVKFIKLTNQAKGK